MVKVQFNKNPSAQRVALLNPNKPPIKKVSIIPHRLGHNPYLMRVLAIAAAGAAHARAGHLELLVLVVRLIGQQHTDLAPAIEEQRNGARPNHQDDEHNANLYATYLEEEGEIINI